ncbi:glucosamine-6-phosphate deaminase [Candidatus Pacearchaeota archaeon CG1_02_32_21]|nr:MAG: glucosamine-6-phosphate deaminase [Candidatus Pacearchaeota archaeon CG1_02_32_21]
MAKHDFKFLVVNPQSSVSKEAVEILCRQIKKKPNLVLGLATGTTMKPFYKELVKHYKRCKLDFSKVKTFNLDEYYGLTAKDKDSFRYFMEENLFRHVNINRKNIYFLHGDINNYKKECDDYEKSIKSFGGIDVQVLGIGVNGHIGFNEPGSSFKSRTRRVKLSDKTRKSNSEDFPSLSSVPKYALTVGIGTIMDSRKILLLAVGDKKSWAVKKALSKKISTKVPASILRRHKDIEFIIDSKVASDIKLLM